MWKLGFDSGSGGGFLTGGGGNFSLIALVVALIGAMVVNLKTCEPTTGIEEQIIIEPSNPPPIPPPLPPPPPPPLESNRLPAKTNYFQPYLSQCRIKGGKLEVKVGNTDYFFNILKEAIDFSECTGKTNLCINEKSAAFSIECGDESLTFSSEDYIIFTGVVNGHKRQLSIKQLIEIVSANKNDETLGCELIPEICFDLRKGYSGFKTNCDGVEISLGSDFSLTLSGLAEDGTIVEIPIIK